MLQQLRRFPLVAVLVLATAVSACGEDDPADPDDGDDETTEVTFTYVPADGGPAITSINVPGDFNTPTPWTTTALPMTEGANGTWSVTVELAPGEYEYKYFFNGASWSENMCADATWGNPSGGEVSPQSEGCNAADNNNAIITVE